MAFAHKVTAKPRTRLVGILKKSKSHSRSRSPPSLSESRSVEFHFPHQTNWVRQKRKPPSEDSSSSSSSSSSDSPPKVIHKKRKQKMQSSTRKVHSQSKLRTISKTGLKDILKTSKIHPVGYDAVDGRVSAEKVVKKKRTQENIAVIRTTELKLPPPKLKSSTSLTGPPLPYRDRGNNSRETTSLARPQSPPAKIKPSLSEHKPEVLETIPPVVPLKKSKLNPPGGTQSKSRIRTALLPRGLSPSDARVGSPSPVSSETHFESLYNNNAYPSLTPISVPSYESFPPPPIQYPVPQSQTNQMGESGGQVQGFYYDNPANYMPDPNLHSTSTYNIPATTNYPTYGHSPPGPGAMYPLSVSEPVSTKVSGPMSMPLSSRYPSFANSNAPATYYPESGFASPSPSPASPYYPLGPPPTRGAPTTIAGSSAQYNIPQALPYSSGKGGAASTCMCPMIYSCIMPGSIPHMTKLENHGSRPKKSSKHQRRRGSSTNVSKAPSYAAPTIASSKMSRKTGKKNALGRKHSSKRLQFGHIEFKAPPVCRCCCQGGQCQFL